MAISLIVIGFLAGIALGQFFKVLILVPTMSIALIATIAVGIARADNVWSIALVSVAVGTALQIGYLIGIGASVLHRCRPASLTHQATRPRPPRRRRRCALPPIDVAQLR
jgi:hypothetical protein